MKVTIIGERAGVTYGVDGHDQVWWRRGPGAQWAKGVTPPFPGSWLRQLYDVELARRAAA